MKLKLSILFVLIFSISQVYSQQFYIKLHSGYGIGTSPKDFSTTNQVIGANYQVTTTRELKNFSFGEGITLNGALGYSINSNIGCELELQYAISSELTLPENYAGTDYYGKGDEILSSKAFMVIPSIFISTELSSIKPYLKIGPIIAFPSITNKNNLNYAGQNPDATSYNVRVEGEFQLDGGMAVGINSTLGIACNVGSNINLIFEVNNKSLSYSPEKGEEKIYKVDGISRLQELTRSQKEIEFVDKVTSTVEDNPNKPSQELKTPYSFSSLAFSLGISLSL